MPDISAAKKSSSGRIQYAVTFSAEETAKAEQAALARIAQQVKIEGFRPGHAPIEMVKERVDDNSILEEAVRKILPDTIRSVMERDNLRPLIQPKVEITARTPIAFTLVFIEKPEVKIKGLEKIKVKKTEVKLDEKDIQRMLDYMRNQYRTVKEVQREAKDGDQVTIDFNGTDEKGVQIPGTDAKGYTVTIGSKSLIPGFEENIVGMKVGETKSFTVVFPEKYHAEHLQKKPATFAVTLHKVEEVVLPEITDEFVKEKGIAETAKEFRETMEKSMREQEEHMDRQRRENELFEALRNATTVDLPEEIVEQEARAIAENLGSQLERQKLTLDAWLAQQKKTPAELKKELEDDAKKRLTLRFGLETALEEKKIEVTPEEMSKAIEEALDSMTKEERAAEEAHYKEGEHGYEETLWRKKVEKFIQMMLA